MCNVGWVRHLTTTPVGRSNSCQAAARLNITGKPPLHVRLHFRIASWSLVANMLINELLLYTLCADT